MGLYFVIASIFKWWCVKKNTKAELIDGATSMIYAMSRVEGSDWSVIKDLRRI